MKGSSSVSSQCRHGANIQEFAPPRTAMNGDHDLRDAAWLRTLAHSCPCCRAPIDVPREHDTRCNRCGFSAKLIRGIPSFASRGSPENDWQDLFDRLASGPDGDTFAAVEYRSPLQQRYIVAAFRDLCGQVEPGERILDVGCGNGVFWHQLFGDRTTVGVDYSVAMCMRASARGMTAYHSDALALPFADEQFDLVYAAEIAQYFDNLSALCTELARVCRPGGRIVLSTLNRTSLIRRVAKFVRKFKPLPPQLAQRPNFSRTAEEIDAAIRDSSATLDAVCWTHFPLPWRRYTPLKSGNAESLASNIVVRLIKRAV